jgi:epoxyqueuosine reductase
MTITEKIKQKAVEIGFDLVGVTTAESLSEKEVDIFQKWIESDYNGQLWYMQNNLDKRTDPGKLLDGAGSVIVTGINYKYEEPSQLSPSIGKVARYARLKDYHIFVKNMLRELAGYIKEEIDGNAGFKICVDSVPLAERALAVRAGLGFIGRNHMLINPEYGMEIFLGEIITTVELEPDEPFVSQCHSCDKCIIQCPTGALMRNGWFDAARCISYLTMVHKGDIEKELSQKIGNCIFGCDQCVLICPYYKTSPPAANKNIKPEFSGLNTEEILDMTEDRFKAKFRNSPIIKIGLDLLKRNVRICLKNI